MKRCGFWVLLFLLLCGSQSGASWFDGFKFGGGLLYNDSTRPSFDSTGVGLHASADVRPSGPFIFTPFAELTAGSTSTSMLGGALSWAVAMRDYQTHILFFGFSGGVMHANSQNKKFAGFHVGYKFPLNERMGMFFQVKYLEGETHSLQGINGYIGITLWGNNTPEE